MHTHVNAQSHLGREVRIFWSQTGLSVGVSCRRGLDQSVRSMPREKNESRRTILEELQNHLRLVDGLAAVRDGLE